MTPEETILICAVRYALGRMSYVVAEVCEYVYYRRNKLSEYCKNIIIRDIEEDLVRYHVAGQTLGMECDEENWKWLLVQLKQNCENCTN